MSARSRLGLQLHVSKDEELGKRDDDYGWKTRQPQSPSIASWLPWRWRKRRVFIATASIVLIFLLQYLLFGGKAGSPSDDTVERTYKGYDAVRAREPQGAPPRSGDANGDTISTHYYNGIVRFYKLAGSLQKISRTRGAYPQNHNVLFAAASLKSAGNLIPMACEMAKIDKNYAHLAVFGRSSISLEDIIELNGVDRESCKVYFHDARGDYAEYSSDARAESATRGALKHINDYMHPQAVVIDDSAKEDVSFIRGMRSKMTELNKPLIEIPSGKYEDLLWMTRLEATSLANWFKPSVEILIQAPLQGSGRLIRLLQSLTKADYSGLRIPHLTIELPPEIDHFVESYLAGFNWPPGKHTPLEPSLLTIRHRIQNSRMSSEQASLRFVESFYPSRKIDQNVLILTSQAEMNPRFLHYLKYSILTYRYTSFGLGANELLGMSLDVPTSFLNGRPGFKAPLIANMSSNRNSDGKLGLDGPSPFKYQAPSTSAVLIFGDKWATFHDFLANRIQATDRSKSSKSKKMVSEAEPSWAEYLLELIRARNWYVLHPASSLVTIHNELAQVPEEFLKQAKSDAANSEPAEPDHLEEEPFLLSQDDPVPIERTETDTRRDLIPLHQMLPFEGELQDLSSLPYVSYVGSVTTAYNLEDQSIDYVTAFRKSTGGCEGEDATRPRAVQDGKTDDLFCLPGQDIRFADDPVPDLDLGSIFGDEDEYDYENASPAFSEEAAEEVASSTESRSSSTTTRNSSVKQKLSVNDETLDTKNEEDKEDN